MSVPLRSCGERTFALLRCSAHVARCFPSCVVSSLCDSSDDFSSMAQGSRKHCSCPVTIHFFTHFFFSFFFLYFSLFFSIFLFFFSCFLIFFFLFHFSLLLSCKLVTHRRALWTTHATSLSFFWSRYGGLCEVQFVHAFSDLRLILATASMAQVKTTVRVSPIISSFFSFFFFFFFFFSLSGMTLAR